MTKNLLDRFWVRTLVYEQRSCRVPETYSNRLRQSRCVVVNRQITIPAELLRRIDLSPGDSVYVTTADDIEDALVVIPVEKLVRWIDAGRQAKSSRATEPESD